MSNHSNYVPFVPKKDSRPAYQTEPKMREHEYYTTYNKTENEVVPTLCLILAAVHKLS